MFELNNSFAFYRIWTEYVQSIPDFLRLIHDFSDRGSTIRPSVYVFRLEKCLRDRVFSVLCFSHEKMKEAGEMREGFLEAYITIS